MPILGAAFPHRHRRPLLGLVPGEGVGSELARAARTVMEAALVRTGRRLAVRDLGGHGMGTRRRYFEPLPMEVEEFCEDVWSDGGAVWCGPVSSETRQALIDRFDLVGEISQAGDLRGEFIVVYDLSSGFVAGSATVGAGGAVTIVYRAHEAKLRRVALLAADLAHARGVGVTVGVDERDVPAIGAAIAQMSQECCAAREVPCRVAGAERLAVDMVRTPERLGVVVVEGVFGRSFVALAGATRCLGAMSITGSGAALFHVTHGPSFDRVGRDDVCPRAAFLSLAMALREGVGMDEEARIIEQAVGQMFAPTLGGPEVRRMLTRHVTEGVIRAIAAD